MSLNVSEQDCNVAAAKNTACMLSDINHKLVSVCVLHLLADNVLVNRSVSAAAEKLMEIREHAVHTHTHTHMLSSTGKIEHLLQIRDKPLQVQYNSCICFEKLNTGTHMQIAALCIPMVHLPQNIYRSKRKTEKKHFFQERDLG